MSDPIYMGLAEVADYLKLSRQMVSNRLKRHPEHYPEPVVRLAMGPIWTRDQWVAYTDKLRAQEPDPRPDLPKCVCSGQSCGRCAGRCRCTTCCHRG